MDYQEFVDLAEELLTEFGVDFTGERRFNAGRDPDTGRPTPAKPTEVFTTLGVVVKYKPLEVDGTNILSGDVSFVCDNSYPLLVGDFIKYDGAFWRVVEPNPIKPDNETLIVHRAQLRRST